MHNIKSHHRFNSSPKSQYYKYERGFRRQLTDNSTRKSYKGREILPAD